MTDMQLTVIGTFVNLLYYCDWVMLSDNGLTSPQLTSYTNLRNSMNSTINNILTYNDTQLATLESSMFGCMSDMANRCKDFTTSMTNLQTAISGL